MARMINECGAVGRMRFGRGNQIIQRKHASLSTTDLTGSDLGFNPGHYGGKLTTNCLSYGMTKFI
jgi:hypothetical protein